MHYKHLTAADRGVIEGLLQSDCTLAEIAKKVGVSESTVSREINQRSTLEGYLAKLAQINYERRRKNSRARKKMTDSKRQKYVVSKLQSGWSPEEIAGWMRRHHLKTRVCHETIYSWLYEDDWAREEKLFEYLRYGRKRRKKKTGRKVNRSKIPNRVSIHQRPDEVKNRTEVGHWEGDSVLYAYKQAINTLNELTTGIVRFTKLERKTADLTAKAMSYQLKQVEAKTVTLDNGSEFVDHQEVTKETGIQVYFADPYSSWQRGSNENTNMLLRGYLPKRADIRELTQEELNDIAEELNNRPRKRLGFCTPNEVYYQLVYGASNLALDLGM